MFRFKFFLMIGVGMGGCMGSKQWSVVSGQWSAKISSW